MNQAGVSVRRQYRLGNSPNNNLNNQRLELTYAVQ